MKFKPLIRLIREAPGLKLTTAAWLLLAAVESAAIPFQAYVLRSLIDGVLTGNAQFYYGQAALIAATIAAVALIAWMRSWVMGHMSEKGAASLRSRAVDSILHMPMARLDAVHSGDHLSRLTNDAGVVRHYLYFELYWLVSAPLEGLLSLVYLFYLDWIMSLVTLALIPVFILLTARVTKPVHAFSGRLQQDLAEVNSVTQDALGGSEVVKAFNLQERMEERHEARLAGAVESGLRLARQQAWVRLASLASGLLPLLVPLALGGWFAVQGRITVGTLLAFLQLLNSVSHPLQRLPNAMGAHQKAMASLDRLHQLIDEPRERQDGEEFSNGQDVILEARDLVFGYENGDVIRGLSFALRRGETVALVGPSGAGKTTVFKLLAGLYAPAAGQVLLYRRPLTEWNLAAARRQMAMVSQDTFLFPGTIAENIALGKPGATRAEIIDAARQANAHEFIRQLPDGYDHILTERGGNLSGGQRQRIAIARAILLNAPILLLDEATSALDTESERLVQDALDKMAASRTTLVIAHRLSTIRNADRILVMDEGKIVESGTHQELLERGGLYRQLYLKQFGADAAEGGVA
ncbi:MAG: ABC transporter ATP-binding protein [Firmicutes bacterium]|mgnify:CR=1 FL=1|nr:ABC transporter ATP-binding protein [Bacillota bacterium]HOB34871.1 ABC transporter ATP-binding protein [Bacillota bacterium]HPZ90385.1 ABC transporter ATP-binding protein [Bacillota bacterium]HQE02483.1 ABC transporter ATP-binding protein [Bacillota bacterium]